MLKYSLFKSNRAQMAETITWVVATIVIIFLLVTSLYFSSLLGKGKEINKGDISLSKENKDWLEVKSNLAYSVNLENNADIELWINNEVIN